MCSWPKFENETRIRDAPPIIHHPLNERMAVTFPLQPSLAAAATTVRPSSRTAEERRRGVVAEVAERLRRHRAWEHPLREVATLGLRLLFVWEHGHGLMHGVEVVAEDHGMRIQPDRDIARAQPLQPVILGDAADLGHRGSIDAVRLIDSRYVQFAEANAGKPTRR